MDVTFVLLDICLLRAIAISYVLNMKVLENVLLVIQISN